MSAAIVGFTVITIIFAPLSFFTSLFALPIDQFQQNQEGKYTTNYIGKWIVTGEIVSLAVTAVAIWIACEYFLKLGITRLIWGLLSKQSLTKLLYRAIWGDCSASEQETDGDLLRNLANKKRVWKSKRQKIANTDIENSV
ncbi:hypothetical protein F4801DRAFT_81567 [Xylaria longipes]|nr:hypothetical protein F4801DRAFT_81567 [Xylaria longipes]